MYEDCELVLVCVLSLLEIDSVWWTDMVWKINGLGYAKLIQGYIQSL